MHTYMYAYSCFNKSTGMCMYEIYKKMPWLNDWFMMVAGFGDIDEQWDLGKKTKKQFEISTLFAACYLR